MKKKEEKETKKKGTAAPSTTTSAPLPPLPESAELDRMFAQLLEDLETPVSARDNMMTMYSNQMKWVFLHENKIRNDNTKKLLVGDNDESIALIKNTPQYFISQLKSQPDVDAVKSLRVSIATEPVIWSNTFRTLKGFPVLFDILSQTEKIPKKSRVDLELLLQIILCIKALMNNNQGMRELVFGDNLGASTETFNGMTSVNSTFNGMSSVNSDTNVTASTSSGSIGQVVYSSYLSKLALCFDCDSPKIKIALYEIFATICIVHKKIGHRLCLDAMSYFKYIKRERTRFGHIVESIKYDKIKSEHEMQTNEVWISSLSLINCLINTPDTLVERTEIRNEFLRLGLDIVIKEIKQMFGSREMPPELLTQIHVFEDFMTADEEEFLNKYTKKHVNTNDAREMFNHLVEVSESLGYLRRSFLSILKNLLALPIDNDTGLKCWVLADKLIAQISFQKERISAEDNNERNETSPTETFTLASLLSSAEDKAELELLKEKFDELETNLQKN